MSPRTVPTYVPLFPWYVPGKTPDEDVIAQFQDLCSRGMDRALGFQESSIETAVQLHSQALDLCTNAFSSTPLVGGLFQSAAQFLASCMELQMKCVTLMSSMMLPGMMLPATLPSCASTGRSRLPAISADRELLERSMDIGSGQQKTRARGRNKPAASSAAG
jgi:hypothetical protein